MFAAGAVIGSAVTWVILKSKYEQRVQEEIETVKEAFISMNSAQDQSEETEDEEEKTSEEYHQVNWDELEDLDEDETDEEFEEYAELANLYSDEKGGAEKVEAKKPYVISPYDFDENGFRTMELTYYEDGVLEDENHEIVTDVDDLLGKGSLDTFGEYEEDSVFVRNEKLGIDFQILRDPRTYEEATGNTPNRVNAR
jgi:hypothetical protein